MNKIKLNFLYLRESNNYQRIIAFTLAEVIIVMGIIGIVAEMTIPGLVNSYQKQITISKLKKTYSTMAQVVRLSEADNGTADTWDWGTSGDAATMQQSYERYWKPYLKNPLVCSSSAVCGYKQSAPWIDLNGDTYLTSWYDPASRTVLVLPDGTLVILRSNATKTIMVDINNVEKPNQIGKDLFIFVIDAKKGLMPVGYNDSMSYINARCTAGGVDGAGDYCAAKIMKEGWQMSSSYPWN